MRARTVPRDAERKSVKASLAVAVATAILVAGVPTETRQAQDPAADDVLASIKVNRTGSPARGGDETTFTVTPGGFVATNYTPRGLLQTAFSLRTTLELVDLPQWGWDERFNITAKFPGAASVGEANTSAMRAAVRTLLRDRFKLVAHRETRPQPVYLLVVERPDGRLGPGLRRSTQTCVRGERSPDGRPCSAFTGPMTGAYGNSLGMDQVAIFLGGAAQRRVVDRTGLTGMFDVDISFASSTLPPEEAAKYPSLFTAVKEQLGLELKPDTAALEVLVVDSIERPAPD